MTRILFGSAVAALVVAIAPAIAQPAPPPPPGVAQGTSVAPVAPPAPMPQMRTQVRVMYDHDMTRDEAVKHVREMFAKLDTNRDGVVTREEIDALHQKMMGAMGMAGDMERRLGERGIMMGDRNQIFDRLDTNQTAASAARSSHRQRLKSARNG